jgi:hypothetical protein
MLQLTRGQRKETHAFDPAGCAARDYITGFRPPAGQENPDVVRRATERERCGPLPPHAGSSAITSAVPRTILLTETLLPPPEYIPPEGLT